MSKRMFVLELIYLKINNMSYIPTIVVDDDNEAVLRNFRWASEKNGVNVVTFSTWDKTVEYLESGKVADAIVLDARGQITKDEGEGDHHIMVALEWVKRKKIPYVIYTAHSEEELKFLKHEWQHGKVLEKAGALKSNEDDVFDFLKNEIINSPKVKYPEPFECFGGDYLDIKYQELLLNIVLILERGEINNPENFLFNPCRIILERVFEKVTEIDQKVLPYALLDFERQRVILSNCYKHLSGIPYYMNNNRTHHPNFLKNTGNEYISKHMDIIITVCHPGSHEIQKAYTSYTFKSVLWAIFDILVWLKKFIDDRK